MHHQVVPQKLWCNEFYENILNDKGLKISQDEKYNW